MADFPTVLTPLVAPSDQIGSPRTLRAYLPSIGTTAYFDPPNNPVPLARAPAGQIGVSDGSRSGTRLAFFHTAATSSAKTSWGIGGAGLALTREVNRRALPAFEDNYASAIEDETPGGIGLAIGQEWFEKIHTFPGALALGNILSTQIRTIELFNAFRRPREPATWETFVNNAGAGVAVTNLPALPFVINAMASFIANVQISTSGPPAINGTLDFTFSAPVPATFSVLVTGNRITIFQYRPQSPIREELLFKTDVIPLFDGSEQRIRLREAPRQSFDFVVRVDDGRSRDAINAVLFDWQARVFGVPLWFEAEPLGAPITVDDTLITVDTTASDYRADSLVIIYDSNFYFEALEVESFTASDITVKTPISKAFDGSITQIMPVRTAYTRPLLSNARFAIGPSDFRMIFDVLDNVDLADIGSFTTYQGTGQTSAKPVLDDFNFMSGDSITEGMRRRAVILDTSLGPQVQFSPWAKGKPLYQFSFEAESQAELWSWRGLLHYLRGSQLAFYIPTGRTDFKPTADIGDGANSIDFPNYGWTRFVGSVTPRADLRILRKDGTVSLHQITGSSEISEAVERLTVTPVISPALLAVDVERMEVLTLSRIANDRVSIDHRRPGDSRLSFKSIGVLA